MLSVAPTVEYGGQRGGEVDSAGLPRRPETNEGGGNKISTRDTAHTHTHTHTHAQLKREELPPGIGSPPRAHSTCPQGEREQ